MKKTNDIESNYELDFQQQEIDKGLAEIYSERQYHVQEVHYWLNNLALEMKETSYSLGKIKHHLGQII